MNQMNVFPSARRRLPRRAWALRVLMTAVVFATSTPLSVRAQDTTRAKLPPGGVITLQDAISIALAQNNAVRFARNAVTLDSLSIRQARNQFLPNLSASSSASQDIANGSGSNPFSASAGLNSGVTLFNGGQNRNILRQARSNAAATGAELGRTRQTVVFVVASDWDTRSPASTGCPVRALRMSMILG